MLDILTIGTATRDVFLTSPLFKVLKDPEHLKRIGFVEGEAECFALGSKIDIGTPTFAFGGGAVNAAITFRRQGFRTAAAIALGKDANGIAATELLKKEKVEALVSWSRENTAYSTVLLSPNGERTVLVSRGASNDLKKKDIPAALKPEWVYVAPGAIHPSVLTGIVSHFVKNGSKLAINPSGYYLKHQRGALLKLLKVAAVTVLNRVEAATLTEKSYEDEKAILKALPEKTAGIVVITDGARGSVVLSGQNVLRAGIFPEEKLADRTGAGDAFGSGFVAGLLQKKNALPSSLQYAIRLASANATAVVESIGANGSILTAAQFSRDKRWAHLPVRNGLL